MVYGLTSALAVAVLLIPVPHAQAIVWTCRNNIDASEVQLASARK